LIVLSLLTASVLFNTYHETIITKLPLESKISIGSTAKKKKKHRHSENLKEELSPLESGQVSIGTTPKKKKKHKKHKSKEKETSEGDESFNLNGSDKESGESIRIEQNIAKKQNHIHRERPGGDLQRTIDNADTLNEPTSIAKDNAEHPLKKHEGNNINDDFVFTVYEINQISNVW